MGGCGIEMRISQRRDYTVRLLTALAQRPGTEFVPVGELAEDLSLPRRFSEQQMSALAKEGILSCQRGPGGGCRFAIDPRNVTIAQVVRALKDDVLDIPHTDASAATEFWAQIASAMEDALGKVTVAELATRQTELDVERAPMYHI